MSVAQEDSGNANVTPFKTVIRFEAMKKSLLRFLASITINSLLISISLLATKGFAEASTPTAKDIKILSFGDSLTAGYNLKPEDAYPAQLEKILLKKGIKLTITNAGISGETSHQGLKRIEWNLKKGGPYDWVLLCLGANDGLRQLDLNLMKKNLEEIILKIQKSGSKVILLGMKLPTNFEKGYRNRFEKIYPEISKKLKIPLFPFLLDGVALDSKLKLDDQMHPNSEGHKIIATRLASFLLPFFN